MGLINAINCNKENLGLGVVDCEIYLSALKTPILIKKSWSMTRTAFEALDAEGFVALVQSGDWQPVLGSKAFTDNTPDATTEEFTGGVMSVVRNAKPMYQFDYDKGIGFHKALYSKNTFGQYNIGLIDESGNIILALSADGTRVTGLEAGMVNTNTYRFRSGDTSANTPFMFQLTNEAQFNRRMAVYTTEQSGIDFNSEINAIVSTVITGTATTTTANINVVATNNENFGIEALTVDNFAILNTTDNTDVTVLTVVAGATEGSYTLTFAAQGAGDKLVIRLYDEDASVAVALVGTNQLYAGESAEITVA